MLLVSALGFQRATRNPADRQTDRQTDTYTNRLPYASGGSAHRGIKITTYIKTILPLCLVAKSKIISSIEFQSLLDKSLSIYSSARFDSLQLFRHCRTESSFQPSHWHLQAEPPAAENIVEVSQQRSLLVHAHLVHAL